jgi:catechol 2,3-dioxygenase
VSQFQLPDEAHMGHVRLQVSDLERALAFYQGLLGFREVSRNGDTVALSSTGQLPYHIVLTPRTTGLYHVAIRFPTRHALARAAIRLATHNWPFQGAADHLVSEAFYLADPDGNAVKLLLERHQMPNNEKKEVNND